MSLKYRMVEETFCAALPAPQFTMVAASRPAAAYAFHFETSTAL
jgi:hypothetical protein